MFCVFFQKALCESDVPFPDCELEVTEKVQARPPEVSLLLTIQHEEGVCIVLNKFASLVITVTTGKFWVMAVLTYSNLLK